MTSADGSFYQGEFQLGIIHGYGEYVWSDGSFYKGNWKENKFHGYGE